MKLIRHISLVLLLALHAAGLSAQPAAPLLNCEAPLPLEQVILHTDRDLYLVGEQIWFQAYCLLDGQPSDRLSKVLYVELFDEENEVVIQQKFRITGGAAAGALAIPEEITTGRHFLRAYTQYQRNFSVDHFAHRLLTVINPGADPKSVSRPAPSGLTFLIAGNQLVDGLPTQVVLQFDPKLCRQQDRIHLLSEDGQRLAGCQALYDGYALFAFTPRAGVAYQAAILTEEGQTIQATLPPVQSSGLTCRIDGADAILRRTPAGDPFPVSIRLFSGGHYPQESRTVNLQESEYRLALPTEKMPAGLYYLSVSRPGDERPLIIPFCHPGRQPLALNVTTNARSFGPREKVSLEIALPGNQTPRLSVTVRKTGLGLDQEAWPGFLLHNPWLLSSYWREATEEDPHLLDMILVLLADQLDTGEQPFLPEGQGLQWIPEMRGLTISGLLRDQAGSAPLAAETSLAAVAAPRPQIHITETKADGSFLFVLPNLEGEQNVFIGWKGAAATPPEILINSDFAGRFPKITPAPLSYEAGQHKLFEELYVQAQLHAAFTPPEQENAFAPPAPLIPISNLGEPDYAVNIASYVSIPTLEEVFREIVPYVLAKRQGGVAYLEVFNEETQQTYDDPLILLDNIPVFDIDPLLEIDPASLEKVEVFNSSYLLGDHLFGGLVSIKTNTYDFAGYQWQAPSVFVNYRGLSPSGAFQHPVYHSGEAKASPKPDYRSTLYWNPAVHTADGKTTLEFYTSDYATGYEVIVRGLTADGAPCFGRTGFEVRARP